MNGATGNLVGGTSASARNTIAGNGEVGVFVSGQGTSGNEVQGNFIGTDVSGNVAVPNYRGVLISGGATYNIVGGTGAGMGNVLSGNTYAGLQIQDVGTRYN